MELNGPWDVMWNYHNRTSDNWTKRSKSTGKLALDKIELGKNALGKMALGKLLYLSH